MFKIGDKVVAYFDGMYQLNRYPGALKEGEVYTVIATNNLDPYDGLNWVDVIDKDGGRYTDWEDTWFRPYKMSNADRIAERRAQCSK